MGTGLLTQVVTSDPILRDGVLAQLRGEPDIDVVSALGNDRSVDVTIYVADSVDAALIHLVTHGQSVAPGCVTRSLVLVTAASHHDVAEIVEAGALGLLCRSSAAGAELAAAVRATARSEPTFSPEMMSGLLETVTALRRGTGRVEPHSLTEREADVLRMIADGYDTVEIAEQLCYSQRTVKNILHAVTERLRLRNRSHAVAYALREGLI